MSHLKPVAAGVAAALEESWGWSQEAEQALLGALLIDALAFKRVHGIVRAGDFYIGGHREIFRTIAALDECGQAADLVTVHEHLAAKDSEDYRASGGIAYLGALAQNTPSALNVHRYAELVAERAQRRRLDGFGQALSRSARGEPGKAVAELLGQARADLERLSDRSIGAQRLHALDVEELLALAVPELEPLLVPWLFQKNLAMVHAKRGVGKTHFALAVAFAVAAGGRFLDYAAPRGRGVLYVDGEMPLQIMQKRLRELASSYGEVPKLLRFITPDLQGRPMPDLATTAGQAEIDAFVREETELVVIDNLSCLVRSGGAENESESWGAVSEWALKHRRAGRAVLFIHHSGKSGAQRGTSKREDLLDTVINLRRPQEYVEADGAVFEVHFEKARSLTGEDIAPIEAKLEQLPGGGYCWTWTSAASRLQDRIRALWDGGGPSYTIADVMREAPCSKSHAHKTLEAAWRAGELKREYPQRRRKETK